MCIEAIVVLSLGLLIFFVSLPLAYRKVPMNFLYGVRIPAAFESEQRWYDVNAYGGRQLAAWAWLVIATGIAGFLLPQSADAIYPPASAMVVLLAVLIPVVRIVRWAGRLNADGASQTSPVSSGEMARTPDVSSASNLLKKQTLVPASVLGILYVAYVAFIVQSAQWLPQRVATHFGASGYANDWMPRESYLHIIAILGLAPAAVIASVGVALTLLIKASRVRSGGRMVNISYLCGDIIWFACLLLCFLAGTHYLTISANRIHPARLSTAGLAVLICAFSLGMIAWSILLCFHLKKKPRVT